MFAQAVGGGGMGSAINQLIKSPLLKLRAHHPEMLLTHIAVVQLPVCKSIMTPDRMQRRIKSDVCTRSLHTHMT
jgi:hypothetical protein